MKKKVTIIKEVETKEGKRSIVWIEDSKSMIHKRSNLPYEKSFEDWDFYSRSIKIALKEYEKAHRIYYAANF